MRRWVILALAALTTALVAAPAALAHGNDDGGRFGVPLGGLALPSGLDDELEEPDGNEVFRAQGTVVSVDAAKGTITADVARPRPPWCFDRGDDQQGEAAFSEDRRFPGDGRRGRDGRAGASSHRGEQRRVTFTTDDDTLVVRNGAEAAVTDLLAGDRIDVTIVTEDASSYEEVLATPAWIIVAKAAKVKKILHGFAGKVTARDATANTLTVDVKYATKSARAMIGAGTKSVTFLTDASTDIRRGGEDVGLGDLAVGDLVGVGVRAAKGSSLPQLEATPARTIVALTKAPTSASQARKAYRRLGARAARARR
jgi:hypothetical protein